MTICFGLLWPKQEDLSRKKFRPHPQARSAGAPVISSRQNGCEGINGAVGENRTLDLTLTKGVLYH
jgi:hypothetical protein